MISTPAGSRPDSKIFLSRYVAEKTPEMIEELQEGEDGRWPFPGEEALRGKESMTVGRRVANGEIVF